MAAENLGASLKRGRGREETRQAQSQTGVLSGGILDIRGRASGVGVKQVGGLFSAESNRRSFMGRQVGLDDVAGDRV